MVAVTRFHDVWVAAFVLHLHVAVVCLCEFVCDIGVVVGSGCDVFVMVMHQNNGRCNYAGKKGIKVSNDGVGMGLYLRIVCPCLEHVVISAVV